jgi:hypothetical protein
MGKLSTFHRKRVNIRIAPHLRAGWNEPGGTIQTFTIQWFWLFPWSIRIFAKKRKNEKGSRDVGKGGGMGPLPKLTVEDLYGTES